MGPVHCVTEKDATQYSRLNPDHEMVAAAMNNVIVLNHVMASDGECERMNGQQVEETQ